MSFYIYQSPIGELGVYEEGGYITNIYLQPSDYPCDYVISTSDVIEETIKQLNEYFSGNREFFDLPLNPKGTDFMQSVWRELCNIPYGETTSYKDIATRIGNHKACRAVGMANNKNPIPIIVPCHRVVGSNGKLVGYRGGLDMKLHLLHLEGVQ